MCDYVGEFQRRRERKRVMINSSINQSLWPFAMCLDHFVPICHITKKVSEGTGKKKIYRKEKTINKWRKERSFKF